MSRTPARVTQADVARAIRAAQQCGAGQTFIYFLRAGEFVKIGHSRQWKARMYAMQVGSPYTIVPLLILIDEPAAEKRLHQRFKADHFRGEWFHMGPAVQEFIKENQKNCVAKLNICDLNKFEADCLMQQEGERRKIIL